MTKDEALKKAFKQAFQLGQDYWYQADHEYVSQNKKSDVTRAKFEQLMEDAIKEALANDTSQERVDETSGNVHEPVAWKYDVTNNQDGTVSVALPDGDELRIVLPNQQEPYCWTWDVWVSGGKWRAEYGWKKPTEKVVNLQPLYTAPPQRKPLTDEEIHKASTEAKMQEHYMGFHSGFIRFARAIEAAHGIKE